jgi:WD40 repeat protein
MNRRISQQDLDTEIRSYLAGAGDPQPASLGNVLDCLPDRAGAAHRPWPAWSWPLRLAALAAVVLLASAAFGLPLILPRPATTPVAPGTFVPTGSMTSPRQHAFGILLHDGRVLIAGGDNTGLLRTAELYDPATGTFSPTGSMSTTRVGTATLLSDGRVLFAGGGDSTGFLASAELYDPATGTFSPTGSMTVARWGQTATLLPDGRVLIAGGGTQDSQAVASAELYDPNTGKFSPTGSMSVARTQQSAALLPNGLVLIAGGETNSPDSTDGYAPLTSAELYDPATGKFSPTGSMPTYRGDPTTAVLSDGRVLIAGGTSRSDPGKNDSVGVPSADVYDSATGRFSHLAGSMVWGQPVVLSDGRVLIVGSSVASAPAELYDPRTGTISPTGSMSTVRANPTAVLLPDGRVLVAGGFGAGNVVFASAQLYQP